MQSNCHHFMPDVILAKTATWFYVLQNVYRTPWNWQRCFWHWTYYQHSSLLA